MFAFDTTAHEIVTFSLGLVSPMTEMTNSPLSGVGGGGAYIDRTVDKLSFVIFVIRSVASLSVDRQNHA